MTEKRKTDPEFREHKRLRSMRKRRRALIRSIYLVPSMATLGNAICGFAAIYICSLCNLPGHRAADPLTQFFIDHSFVAAAYLIFLAMVFDALDGRLARFTRHTTDFGGQLDSMADVISFGVAPAIVMLQFARKLPTLTLEHFNVEMPFALTRAIWAIGAVYASCAAIRLARFNVSNQHGEQHHFSFLGLPSPGAGGTVAAWVLMCAALEEQLQASTSSGISTFLDYCYFGAVAALPLVTLAVGLLMVSTIRYPHLVNRYLKGKKSIGRFVAVVVVLGFGVVFYKYALAAGMLFYTLWSVGTYLVSRYRKPAGEPPKVA